MKLEYILEEQDFLTHQLYAASKSENIEKKRKRTRLRVPMIYAVVGIFACFMQNYGLGGVFLVLAVLWYVFYPLWEKGHYLKHYRNYIKENYSERVGKAISFEWIGDHLFVKDAVSEGKILISEIEEIDEIGVAFYIKIRSGVYFILPKDKVGEVSAVRAELQKLAEEVQVPYKREEEWVWK